MLDPRILLRDQSYPVLDPEILLTQVCITLYLIEDTGSYSGSILFSRGYRALTPILNINLTQVTVEVYKLDVYVAPWYRDHIEV